MIPEIYKTTTGDQSVQKALSYLHKQAVPVSYTSTTPKLAHIPTGGLVIHDDGAGTIRLYFRTGKDNAGYASVTQITA